jgi:hypothetical protein
MTTHKLARLLLAGPDVEAVVMVEAQHGLIASLARPRGAWYQQAKVRGSGRLVDEGQGKPCVVLGPADGEDRA